MSSTILALDIGERKIGVARANTIARIAEPLLTLPNNNDFVVALQHLIKEHNADILVVGLPRGLDGQETAQTSYVREFAAKNLNFVPIKYQDEALTSVNATQMLESRKRPYNKKDVDALAATLILEDYLREVTHEAA